MNLIKTIEENFLKIKKYSDRKSSKNNLSNISWLLLDESDETEVIYIFRNDSSLILSENGEIKRCKYEFIVDSDNLIVQYNEENGILYDSLLIDNKFLILKQSSKNKYKVFANKTKYKDYIKANISKIIKEQSKIGFSKSEEIYEKPNQKKGFPRVVVKKLKDGRNFEIHSTLEAGYDVGDKVTINGKIAEDGIYKFGWFDSLPVENGKLKGT